MAKLKDTNIDGVLEVTGGFTLGHKMTIRGTTTDGSIRENFQPCNQSNNCVIGWGNYSNNDGDTNIYGASVNVSTKENSIKVDNIQIAKTESSAITSYSSGWNYYGSSAGNTPTVRRWGKVVSITGAMTNTEAVTLNTTHVKVFTIPSGYRPSQDVLVLCQGSGNNEYVMQIKTNGEVYFGRYGTSSNVQASAGTWFPFHACWVMD